MTKKWKKIKLPKLPPTLEIKFCDKQMNWEDADKWAKEQGGRLPTKFELQALAESDKIPKDKQGFWYWSSSAYSTLTSGAWTVYLSYGGTTTNNRYFTATSVLCVRE